jgi:transcriptional regulator with XRE-family HTH domain
MGKRQAKMSDEIRQAVDDSGLSRYRICKELGIDQGLFSRFMAGTSALSLDNLDKLADLLGLKIVATGKKIEFQTARLGRPPKAR